MLETLSERLHKVLRQLKGEATVTASTLEPALREIRLSLLEADVNFKVVKEFVENVRAKAMGTAVQESLNPTQQVVKIVHEELTALLGGSSQELARTAMKPRVIMLVGLQGSGKTTTAGKLALHLKKLGRSVLLAPLDLKRPAAEEQLRVIAVDAGAACFDGKQPDLDGRAAALLAAAREKGYDDVIADTAGRLHVDDELMAELKELRDRLQPAETIYVADSLTGQDAVNSAQAFATAIGLDSLILTKLDADSRGGAALSIARVTGRPIKFAGVGEKTEDFQPFHPERLAAKILGMGDMLTLIEKAQQEFDEKQAETAARRMLSNEFNLDDFADQLRQVSKLGSLDEIVSMLPRGMTGLPAGGSVPLDERRLLHTIAIIGSMTRKERNNPRLIDGRRRLRIARGSGRPVQEVNQLLKSFQEMKKYMKKPLLRRMMKKFDFSGKIG
jgi:signal recognition particle subunit SRP54